MIHQPATVDLETMNLPELSDRAWEASRSLHGNILTVHVPGMFVVNGRRGRFRAVSITGDRCDLDCEHCKGSLLATMPAANSPQALLDLGMQAWERGDHGMLVTGGCDSAGRLPWADYLPVIRSLKQRTGLVITVHAGQVDRETASALKDAGVNQALVDLIADEETAREVYHLPKGTETVRATLEALALADMEIVPHILFGLYYGKEKGEKDALEILASIPLKQYVVVVIMPKSGTPMADIDPPAPEAVARFLALARMRLPHLKASLGCARPRGRYRQELDLLAVRAGINALALPSDNAIAEAESRGLEVRYRETCCSLG